MAIAGVVMAATSVVATGTGARVVAALVATLGASAFAARWTRLLRTCLWTVLARTRLLACAFVAMIVRTVVWTGLWTVVLWTIIRTGLRTVVMRTGLWTIAADGAEVMAAMLLEVRGAMDVSRCTMDVVVVAVHVVVVVIVQVRVCTTVAVVDARSAEVVV